MNTRSAHDIILKVNGEEHKILAGSSETLLIALRSKLGLTGSKPGCLNGDCGACTVLINGVPHKSCLSLAVEMDEADIMTIEGLKEDPIQTAFVEHFAFQCGYCTSGFIMNCKALVDYMETIDENVITEWLESNICRCTGYKEIEEAVKSVLTSRGNTDY
ncbi:(2Fe-2S)-binding protein [Falsibacillus pallidus]|uniref:Carbon-monoxide dehydrogenase small subunit n=1 Tax=Falsibacillus pallidus TaxID=493781 RepID=A0A370GQC9_9BACI|nr:(2Fe-2S)-binding protein [Falsibacillus pallidus]RDI45928.1 carbon-monoxide dehydrogenase small subunit [Falsibacillus pallidus]